MDKVKELFGVGEPPTGTVYEVDVDKGLEKAQKALNVVQDAAIALKDRLAGSFKL